VREHDFDSRVPKKRRLDDEPEPVRRGRLTEHEKSRLARVRDEALLADVPDGGDRWSTWGDAEHGPKPRPPWLITDLAAVDHELGTIKSGKEADVCLVSRGVPGGRSCLLAAKRYRGDDHRMFHRDAGYLEGRRMRRSRETRAMASRSAFGRNLIAEQWAVAEFAILSRLWSLGLPVPYPVQRDGTELLLEFLGDADGRAAPRLAELRPGPDQLAALWGELVDALLGMAALGLSHGDLSAYNILVHDGRLVLIDLPQVVDVVANPAGPEFLARDVRNIARWFTGRGLPEESADAGSLIALLRAEAGLR
jgi:RIO kinase 1